MPERTCPCCRRAYALEFRTPPAPDMLVSYGTEEDVREWEEAHAGTVLSCLNCGWSSEDE